LSAQKYLAEELEESDKILFREMLAWVKKNHKLSARHLDELVANEKTINHYFPTKELLLSNIDSLVSDYSKVSPEEFFAEAFSFFLAKKFLPHLVKKRMRITIKRIGGKL